MQNISKILSINKFTLFWLVLLLSVHTSFAKIDFPISKTEVDSLKRSEESLWYADGSLKSEAKKPKAKRVSKQSNEIPVESQGVSSVFSIIGFIFQILVWVILAAAILGAIYIIVKNLKGFTFKTNTTITPISEKITEQPDVKDIININFSTYIEKCIKEKNYKLATRYYYLWVMKILNEANLIVFNIDKTNQDYAKELSKKSIFGKERLLHFIQCTNYYEYLWFGDFPISESVFVRIENTFKDFINKRA